MVRTVIYRNPFVTPTFSKEFVSEQTKLKLQWFRNMKFGYFHKSRLEQCNQLSKFRVSRK